MQLFAFKKLMEYIHPSYMRLRFSKTPRLTTVMIVPVVRMLVVEDDRLVALRLAGRPLVTGTHGAGNRRNPRP